MLAFFFKQHIYTCINSTGINGMYSVTMTIELYTFHSTLLPLSLKNEKFKTERFFPTVRNTKKKTFQYMHEINQRVHLCTSQSKLNTGESQSYSRPTVVNSRVIPYRKEFTQDRYPERDYQLWIHITIAFKDLKIGPNGPELTGENFYF